MKAMLVLALLASVTQAGQAAARPARVFEVMSALARMDGSGLWPGFKPEAVPAAVYDGRRTFLFGFSQPVRGFRPAEVPVPHLVLKGAHPDVLGNRRVLLQGVWTATAVLSEAGGEGEPRRGLEARVALLMHEKFHAFQALRHPDWAPNDLILLRYPPDNAASWALRRLEVEALRRTIATAFPSVAASWARTALGMRDRRLAALPAEVAGYERQLQLLEGLAQYVEVRTGGGDPFVSAPAVGKLPRAARELGYLEGCVVGLLLDRFRPGWKDEVEEGGIKDLAEALRSSLPDSGLSASFTAGETAEVRAGAEAEAAGLTAWRRKVLDQFVGSRSIGVEILIPDKPFRLTSFDPFTCDRLDERRLVHWHFLQGRIGEDIIQVAGRPCLVESDDSGRARRLLVLGLSRKPPMAYSGLNIRQAGVRFNWEGVNVQLRSAVADARQPLVRILVR